jgi:hypothetical protein
MPHPGPPKQSRAVIVPRTDATWALDVLLYTSVIVSTVFYLKAVHTVLRCYYPHMLRLGHRVASRYGLIDSI